MIKEMFVGAFEILFPRKRIAKKYNRNRLGQFSIKAKPIIWIDDAWKASL